MNDHLMIYQTTLNLAETLLDHLQYLARKNSDPAHGQRLTQAQVAVMELQDEVRTIIAQLDPPTPASTDSFLQPNEGILNDIWFGYYLIVDDETSDDEVHIITANGTTDNRRHFWPFPVLITCRNCLGPAIFSGEGSPECLSDVCHVTPLQLDPPTLVCEGCGETAVWSLVKSKYILSDYDMQGLWVCAVCEKEAEEYANDEWNWPHSDYPPTPAEVV